MIDIAHDTVARELALHLYGSLGTDEAAGVVAFVIEAVTDAGGGR